MWASRGSSWGPRPLPDFLNDQLGAQGFTVEDSGRIARQINEQSGTAGAVSRFVDLGSCKFLEGDIDGAIASWRHAISSEHDAAAARALLNLGLLYEHLHLHDRALSLLAAVADRDVAPYVVPAAMASARCQVALGDTGRAMESMARLAQRTMETHPDGPELIETLYALGDVSEQAGRSDRAERSWRVAAASPPSAMQQAASDRLLQLLVDQGHDEEVRDLISRKVGATNGAKASTLLEQADLLSRLGDKAEVATLVQAVDGADLRPSDRFRLASIKVQCGQVNLAIDEFESLLAHNDPNVQLRAAFSLGELYRNYDMHDAAATMYERAANADDRYWSAKASLRAGDLLDSIGDHDAALANWKRVATCEIAALASQASMRLAASSSGDLGVTVDPDVTEPDGVVPDVVVPDGVVPDGVVPDGVVPDVTEPDVVDLREPGAGSQAAHAVPPAGSREPQIISLDAIDDDFTIDPPPQLVEPSPAKASVAVAPDRPDPVAPSAAPEPEPVVVVLSALEGDLASDETEFLVEQHDQQIAGAPSKVVASFVSETPSAFASHLGDAPTVNPYAALAPDGEANDVPAAARNPYAELAPNYDEHDFEPPADVEPGDWESMLEDWPSESGASDSSEQRSSAFSRYT